MSTPFATWTPLSPVTPRAQVRSCAVSEERERVVANTRSFEGCSISRLCKLFPLTATTAASVRTTWDDGDGDAAPPPPPPPQDQGRRSNGPLSPCFLTSLDGRWIESPVSPVPHVDEEDADIVSVAAASIRIRYRQSPERTTLTFTAHTQSADAGTDADIDEEVATVVRPSPLLNGVCTRIRASGEAQEEAAAFGAELAYLRRGAVVAARNRTDTRELVADAEALVREALRVRDEALAARDEARAEEARMARLLATGLDTTDDVSSSSRDNVNIKAHDHAAGLGSTSNIDDYRELDTHVGTQAGGGGGGSGGGGLSFDNGCQLTTQAISSGVGGSGGLSLDGGRQLSATQPISGGGGGELHVEDPDRDTLFLEIQMALDAIEDATSEAEAAREEARTGAANAAAARAAELAARRRCAAYVAGLKPNIVTT